MTDSNGWILTASQQQLLDQTSVRGGTTAEKLMESAGANAAKWILSHSRPRAAVVLAGPGGNGGDAFVVARHLLEAGVTIHVFARCEMDSCLPVIRTMVEHLLALGVNIHLLTRERSLLDNFITQADCVIDGLYGSGLTRPLAGEDEHLIALLNDSTIPIISLDLPSGLPADSGRILGPAIRADITLAMGFYKPSHWLYPAAGQCGHIHIVDVDYPLQLVASVRPTARVYDTKAIAAMIPPRDPTGHKGTFGHVLAVAGSQGMTGAAILCARSALRAGAGFVTLALSETITPVLQTAVPEAMTIPLPDKNGRLVDPALIERLEPTLKRADVLAIGPGLSRDPGTMELVRRIITNFSGKLVIDADAIHALVGHIDLLAELAGRTVLTPHPREFGDLMGASARHVDEDRLEWVNDFISRHAIALVLKGRPTVIGLPDRQIVVNPTGNTGLATGGSGDVLTGLIAGLVASGSSLFDAAITAPFIHGLAADRWAAEFSERSLTPSDLLDALPRIFKELEP